MMRSLLLPLVLVAASGCLNVESAREQGAQHTCQLAQKCGDVGSGQKYATPQECLTDARGDWLNTYPTDRCGGKINGDALQTCLTAIDNSRCDNLIDYLSWASKCSASEVCTAGAPAGCNCGQGQTCCNNQCVNLQTDRNNCGACGTTCGSSVSCQSGVCR